MHERDPAVLDLVDQASQFAGGGAGEHGGVAPGVEGAEDEREIDAVARAERAGGRRPVELAPLRWVSVLGQEFGEVAAGFGEERARSGSPRAV